MTSRNAALLLALALGVILPQRSAHADKSPVPATKIATRAEIDAAWNVGDFRRALVLLETQPPSQRTPNRWLAIATAAFNARQLEKARATLDMLRAQGALNPEQGQRIVELDRKIAKEEQRPIKIEVTSSNYGLSDETGQATKDLAKVDALKALAACYAKVGDVPCERLTDMGPPD